MRPPGRFAGLLFAGLLVIGVACARDRDPEVAAPSEAPTMPGGTTPAATPTGGSPSPSVSASPDIEDLTLKELVKRARKDKKSRNTKDDDGGGVAAAPMGPSGTQKDPPELKPQGEGGSRYSKLSANVGEPQPDGEKSGSPPDYAEAKAVSVKGMGKQFRVTITFFGQVPPKMSSRDTYMVISYGMSGKNGGDDDYGFGARASEEGWLAYAGSRGSASQFPGTFFVRGNTIEMNIPWSFVGGPRAFQWYASSSWFETRDEQTSYLFDPIPNGRSRYPN